MVETGGLENRLALTGYGGSNPSPQYIHFIINEMESLLALRNPNVLFVTVCWGRMLLAESLEVIHQTSAVIPCRPAATHRSTGRDTGCRTGEGNLMQTILRILKPGGGWHHGLSLCIEKLRKNRVS